MVSGILAPDSGQVLVDARPLGGDADAAKGRLGLVPQDLALYDDLTAEDNLRFFGSLQGMGARALEKAMASTLEIVGLSDRAKDKVKDYSGGMKRRLNLAAGLLHDPAVLLLDEPTVGVDPQSRNAIFDTLEILRDRGKAILYTTHYMEEAERLCNRIIVMDHGKVIASDTLDGLKRLLPTGNRLLVELAAPLPAKVLAGLHALPGVASAAMDGERLALTLDDLARGAAASLAWLAAHGAEVSGVESERVALEDVFLALTGRNLRDS
jgi:ABC-2 type transport system ATP-binding protein